MHTKMLSLPILVLVSLVFLASCTAGFENDKDVSPSRMTTEDPRGDSPRSARDGRSRQYDRESSNVSRETEEKQSADNLITDEAQEEVPSPRASTLQSVTSDGVSQAQVTPKTVSPQISSVKTPVPVAPSGTSKNISKSITYTTDHGKERVTVSFVLTIDSTDSITGISASAPSADRESRQYISRFNSAAKSKIVGQKISSLSLSTVGGASDTTDAFQEIVSSL